MVNQNTVSELVSRAWDHQREGRNDAAITEFQKVVQQYPKDIDANYGLGLAQKNAGNIEAAIQTFEHALELVNESKSEYEAGRDVSQEADTIKTPEDDRFMMLSRMVNQRLAELKHASQS